LNFNMFPFEPLPSFEIKRVPVGEKQMPSGCLNSRESSLTAALILPFFVSAIRYLST